MPIFACLDPISTNQSTSSPSRFLPIWSESRSHDHAPSCKRQYSIPSQLNNPTFPFKHPHPQPPPPNPSTSQLQLQGSQICVYSAAVSLKSPSKQSAIQWQLKNYFWSIFFLYLSELCLYISASFMLLWLTVFNQAQCK